VLPRLDAHPNGWRGDDSLWVHLGRGWELARQSSRREQISDPGAQLRVPISSGLLVPCYYSSTAEFSVGQLFSAPEGISSPRDGLVPRRHGGPP
jgi:hypothetical protein